MRKQLMRAIAQRNVFARRLKAADHDHYVAALLEAGFEREAELETVSNPSEVLRSGHSSKAIGPGDSN